VTEGEGSNGDAPWIYREEGKEDVDLLLPDCTRIHLVNTRYWGKMVQEGEGKRVEHCRRCKSTRNGWTKGTCGGDGRGSGGAGRGVVAAASLFTISPYPIDSFSPRKKKKRGARRGTRGAG
jgi:hypothetical protein